ncbi:radical SAM protein [Actinoalloteichus hymeniacidonis]|nr:radical SAM/SPASM domain-containing protein [Actinoalloteichus hymeniacidonis]
MIYTFGCNAACDHCLVESNPRKKKKLDPATAIDLLTTGAKYGKSFLDLSGGEAMLFPEEVLEVASAARDLGYYICLNTNAYWARTPDKAVETLAGLKAAGVQAVFPSASAYHLRYVPLERVKNLRAACRELDMVYELNWVYSDQPEADEHIKQEMGLEGETLYYDGLVTAGNNSETIANLEKIYTRRTPEQLDDCLSVHLAVNPHGHVVTSCNMTYDNAKFKDTPFFLGNFHEQSFEDILRAEAQSPVLQFIYHNPHPALHNLMANDQAFGDYYRETFSERSYFSVIDYYLELFRDQRTAAWLQSNLPAVVEEQQRQRALTTV